MDGLSMSSGTSASASLLRTSNKRDCTDKSILCNSHRQRLSAFSSVRHHFSYCPSRSCNRVLTSRCSRRPGIILPILVASMVCSVFSFVFCVLNNLKCGLSFCKIDQWTLFEGSFLFGHMQEEEKVEETYIMVKAEGVQRGLVSLLPLCFL